MTKVKYYYFDDNEQAAKSVKDNLDSDNLDIIHKRELSWNEIINDLLTNEKDFDGLILDWRLDGEDDSKADYSSEALAQQCRMLQVGEVNKRKFEQSFPIVLCSSQPGFDKIHSEDTTSINLFDAIYHKNDLEEKEELLIVLVDAYRRLNKVELSIKDVLGLKEDDQELINIELISKVDNLLKKQPHEMVLFLLNEVIKCQGALIDENILAARLGIDILSEGWDELKNEISFIKFDGILNIENRWWSDILNAWWTKEFNGTSLHFLSASERLEYLESKFPNIKGKLNKPSLAEGSDSDEFWTVCFGTGIPLAEIDGFIIDKHLHYAWQDKLYVCLNEAKNEVHRGEKWDSLLPYEEERLKSYFENK